ncbi:MAG: DUF4870 domain-containing protein [Myxococcota bacterium]
MTPQQEQAQHPFELPGYRPSEDEKIWGLLTHVSALVTTFLGPIIALAVKGNESRWVRAHAIEALNFNITLLIVYAVGLVTSFLFVGICLLMPAALASIVLSIVAGVNAFQGHAYRYPLTIRFIKD